MRHAFSVFWLSGRCPAFARAANSNGCPWHTRAAHSNTLRRKFSIRLARPFFYILGLLFNYALSRHFLAQKKMPEDVVVGGQKEQRADNEEPHVLKGFLKPGRHGAAF